MADEQEEGQELSLNLETSGKVRGDLYTVYVEAGGVKLTAEIDHSEGGFENADIMFASFRPAAVEVLTRLFAAVEQGQDDDDE